MSVHELDDDRIFRNELLGVLNKIASELEHIRLIFQYMKGIITEEEYHQLSETL